MPTGINTDEEDDPLMVIFMFEKFLFYLCQRCRKLGQWEDYFDDPLLQDDEVLLIPIVEENALPLLEAVTSVFPEPPILASVETCPSLTYHAQNLPRSPIQTIYKATIIHRHAYQALI